LRYERILIVDDSSTSRMIIKRCLAIAGYSESIYLEANDGLEALEVLKNDSVNLIISDLNMPKMDGVTFIQKLRLKEEYQDLPILVISSIFNEVTSKILNQAGVQGIIKKPISPYKIQEVLG